MAEVIWRVAALDEIDEATAYIRQFDPEAAEKIARRLRELGQSLADFPNRGRPAGRDLRELTLAPPYILTYRVSGGEVYIEHVRHGRQRPLKR